MASIEKLKRSQHATLEGATDSSEEAYVFPDGIESSDIESLEDVTSGNEASECDSYDLTDDDEADYVASSSKSALKKVKKLSKTAPEKVKTSSKTAYKTSSKTVKRKLRSSRPSAGVKTKNGKRLIFKRQGKTGAKKLSVSTEAWRVAHTPWLTPKTDCDYEPISLDIHDPKAFRIINAPRSPSALTATNPGIKQSVADTGPEALILKRGRFFIGCRKILECYNAGGDEHVGVTRQIDVEKTLDFLKRRMDPRMIYFLGSKTFCVEDFEELESFSVEDLEGWGNYLGYIVWPSGEIESYVGSSVASKGMGTRLLLDYETGLQHANAGVFHPVVATKCFAQYAALALRGGARLLMRPLITYAMPADGESSDLVDTANRDQTHILESMFITYCQTMRVSTNEELMSLPNAAKPISRAQLSKHCRSLAPPGGRDVSDQKGRNGMLPIVLNPHVPREQTDHFKDALESQGAICPLCTEPIDLENDKYTQMNGCRAADVLDDHQIFHFSCKRFLDHYMENTDDTPRDLRLLPSPEEVLATVRARMIELKDQRAAAADKKLCPTCGEAMGTGNTSGRTAGVERIPCLEKLKYFCMTCTGRLREVLTGRMKAGGQGAKRRERVQEADCSLEEFKVLLNTDFRGSGKAGVLLLDVLEALPYGGDALFAVDVVPCADEGLLAAPFGGIRTDAELLITAVVGVVAAFEVEARVFDEELPLSTVPVAIPPDDAVGVDVLEALAEPCADPRLDDDTV
ncbi:hypothetical protein B0A48_03899 [Cryoendolithus antarcticus]|uniref:Uncharacterized protein n=1 Tax=Cryoendolithus antarcticus TaxID=1507870 RepID=A0A1V8TH80_9PEZI|nr:hypothetical protein B0A48_03899 [Cryoendolithus antarcticus]